VCLVSNCGVVAVSVRRQAFDHDDFVAHNVALGTVTDEVWKFPALLEKRQTFLMRQLQRRVSKISINILGHESLLHVRHNSTTLRFLHNVIISQLFDVRTFRDGDLKDPGELKASLSTVSLTIPCFSTEAYA